MATIRFVIPAQGINHWFVVSAQAGIFRRHNSTQRPGSILHVELLKWCHLFHAKKQRSKATRLVIRAQGINHPARHSCAGRNL
jgi:hypothetical protein